MIDLKKIKPSELIRLAVNDMSECEKDPEVTITQCKYALIKGQWIKKTEVNFPGCLAFKSLGLHVLTCNIAFSDTIYKNQFKSLQALSIYDYANFCMCLNIRDYSSEMIGLQLPKHHLGANNKGFKNNMLAIADYLEKKWI